MPTSRFANLFDDAQGNLGNFRQSFSSLNDRKSRIDDAGMTGSYLSPGFMLGQYPKPAPLNK